MEDARKSSAARLREAAVLERRAAQRYQHEKAPRPQWQPYIDRAQAWEKGAEILEQGIPKE